MLYKTVLQKAGKLNGFEVVDYLIEARNEQEQKQIEGMGEYKNGMIFRYKTEKAKETSFLDTVFTESEQEDLKASLTPAEIKDALHLLLENKQKATEEQEIIEKPMDYSLMTVDEIKEELTKKNIEFNPKSKKAELIELLQK